MFTQPNLLFSIYFSSWRVSYSAFLIILSPPPHTHPPSSPSSHLLCLVSFTYQQYHMSPGHQSCSLPPPLPCLFLIFSPHLLPFMAGANPFFTCQQYQAAYHSAGHQRLLQPLCSACCLSLITAPQPSAKLQREGERALAWSSHTAAALFLLGSRWRHRPTVCMRFLLSSPVWDVCPQSVTASRAKSS